jgi:histidinol-phosphate aminotransferase
VLDEAYNEYLPAKLKADSIAWLDEFPNLIVTRTFSKAYGLAGLRVGYACCSGWSRRSDEPGAPTVQCKTLFLFAAAAAALNDLDFVRRGFE